MAAEMDNFFNYSVLDSVTLKFKDCSVFFDRLTGNNGDILIKFGTNKYIEDKGFNLISTPEDADVFFICGGGWLSYTENINIYKSEQTKALIEFKDKPIVIFPSSVNKSSVSSLRKLVLQRSAETVIFARDPISYELLLSLTDIQGFSTYLEHDLAFNLHNSSLLYNLKDNLSEDFVLIVERFDIEGSTPKPAVYKIPETIRSYVPSQLKSALKSVFSKSIYSNSVLSNQTKEFVEKNYKHLKNLPYYNDDISLPHNVIFDDFVKITASSAITFTTRLHVGILSGLLGKETFIIPANNHKYIGCYNYSIKDNFPSVKLLQFD